MSKTTFIGYERVFHYINTIFGDAIHAKRIASLSGAVTASIRAGSLAISAVGRILAVIRGINPKHGIKEIDRMLSNPRFKLDDFFQVWVTYMIAARKEIVVALDWTDFDPDNQSTLAIHLVTKHGRASALLWKTFMKDTLKNNRNDYEDELIAQLRDLVPHDVKVTILADRGFGDVAFFEFLRCLGFEFIIRIKKNISVILEGESSCAAKDLLMPSGMAKVYRQVKLTSKGYVLASFVTVWDKKMKEAWFLASSDPLHAASDVVKLYGRRFTIEERFRDIKDPRFGFGLSQVSISQPKRRDRMLLVCAIMSSLLTLLGAAGEALAWDRGLKSNTSKKRQHSLLFQGCHYYNSFEFLCNDKLESILKKFTELIHQHVAFQEIFGVI